MKYQKLSMWYKINVQMLLIQSFPLFFRNGWFGAIMSLVASEITDINNQLIIQRNSSITKVKHNGQVCKLRKILNDTFDYQRRIKIVDGVLKKPRYIYTDGEKKPTWIGSVFIYTDEEIFGDGADFTVLIPSDLRNYQIEIKAMVDFYKLAGKRYKIKVDENI